MSPNQQTLPTQPIRIPTKMSGRKKTDTSTTSPTKEAPSDTAANDIATYSNQYPTTESAPQLETSRTKPHKNNKGNTTKAYKQQSTKEATNTTTTSTTNKKATTNDKVSINKAPNKPANTIKHQKKNVNSDPFEKENKVNHNPF